MTQHFKLLSWFGGTEFVAALKSYTSTPRLAKSYIYKIVIVSSIVLKDASYVDANEETRIVLLDLTLPFSFWHDEKKHAPAAVTVCVTIPVPNYGSAGN